MREAFAGRVKGVMDTGTDVVKERLVGVAADDDESSDDGEEEEGDGAQDGGWESMEE